MRQQNRPASSRPSRRYATPKRDHRAAATRAKILAAAKTLFLREGYVRTSMRSIAALAGVSEKTMYLTFATKATLLRQVIQLSVRGDHEETPLAERSEWRQLVAGPVDEVFARFAAQNANLMTRTAHLIALGEAAAASDPELAEYRDQAHAETRANLRALAAELHRRGALNPDTTEQDAADTIYAIATNESVFLRLTRECGWTPAAYADLITRTLNATLGSAGRLPGTVPHGSNSTGVQRPIR